MQEKSNPVGAGRRHCNIALDNAPASDMKFSKQKRADLLEAVRHTLAAQKVLDDRLFVLENLLDGIEDGAI
jgi:hypothetical protein